MKCIYANVCVFIYVRVGVYIYVIALLYYIHVVAICWLHLQISTYPQYNVLCLQVTKLKTQSNDLPRVRCRIPQTNCTNCFLVMTGPKLNAVTHA